MKNTLFILLLFLLSCNQSNQFVVHSSGLEYRFVEENPNAPQPQLGDGLVLLLKYTSANDSVIFNGPIRLLHKAPSHSGGSIEDAFGLMHKGDSAEFLIDAESFITKTTQADIIPDFVEKGSKLKFYVRLNEILSPQEMEKMQADIYAQRKAAETMLLDDYIERNEIKQTPTESGLFIIKEKTTRGALPKTADSLEVHYTGMLLDGTIFDSSRRREETFKFVLGVNQVIKGWDEAFATLRKGEKARLIIPSSLAYGKEGYSDLIPPFSTLIFDVELLDIK